MRLLVTSLAALGACQPEPPAQAPEIVAFVDALPIRGEALMLRALRQYAVLDPQDWGAVLERLLEDEIELQLCARGARQNIKLTPARSAAGCAATALPRHRFAGLDRFAAPCGLARAGRAAALGASPAQQAADAQPVTEQAIAAWIAKHPTEEKVIVRHLLTASESGANKALSCSEEAVLFCRPRPPLQHGPEAQQGGSSPMRAASPVGVRPSLQPQTGGGQSTSAQ